MGIEHLKKNGYTPERKMNMHHEVSHRVCFLTFSVKRKENDLQRKYTFWGALGKCIFSYNFTDGTKFMILFHVQRVGTERIVSRFLTFEK